MTNSWSGSGIEYPVARDDTSSGVRFPTSVGVGVGVLTMLAGCGGMLLLTSLAVHGGLRDPLGEPTSGMGLILSCTSAGLAATAAGYVTAMIVAPPRHGALLVLAALCPVSWVMLLGTATALSLPVYAHIPPLMTVPFALAGGVLRARR